MSDIAGVLSVLVVLALLVAILILPLVWIYRDAAENSTHSAIMWVAIVFFAGYVIGFILYFIFGRNATHPRARPRR